MEFYERYLESERILKQSMSDLILALDNPLKCRIPLTFSCFLDINVLTRWELNIYAVFTVRDLGVTLDQELTFAPHVNRLCRDCYYSLLLLHLSILLSRLDYCSTRYAGLPGLRLGCLDWVIRTTARLIGGIPRTGHISAYILDVLHRLPFHHIPSRCPGLEVPTGPCSGLPPRSLLSHPGHQRLQWYALLFGMGFHWHCDCSQDSLWRILLWP